VPLPTRDELLTKVDARFRERFPTAPARLDPNDESQAEMIDGWYDVHREILSKLTDEAFFSLYPDAPERLDPSDSAHATYIEYWNDIAAQIDGRQGQYDWSSAKAQDPDAQEPIEMPAQDGSKQLDDRIHYVHTLMQGYAEAVGATTLGPKVLTHTTDQIESIRRLVRDGTFQT